MIRMGETGAVVGLPEGLTAKRVTAYFRNFGKHPDDIQASITSHRLIPNEVSSAKANSLPGERLQMDQFSPKFISQKLKKTHRKSKKTQAVPVDSPAPPVKTHQVVPAQGSGATCVIAAIDTVSGVPELFAYKTNANPEIAVNDVITSYLRMFGFSAKEIAADKAFVTKTTRELCADYKLTPVSKAGPGTAGRSQKDVR
jgi:hypothetical protein